MKYFLQTLLLLLATAPGLASATIFLDDRNACQAISGIYRTTTSIADQVAECRLHESFTLPRDEYLEIASGYGLYVDSGATLTNQGRIRVYPRAKLQVDDGFLSNEELIENDGDVTVLSGFLFNNGTIENDRHINVLDRPNSSNSNVLLNKGPINLANDGQIRNEGIVFNDSGGQITSIAGSSIHNYGHYDSRDDRIAGTFTNYAQGVANVSRTLTLENAAVFRNEGSLVIARSSGALILNNGSRLDNVMTGQIRVRINARVTLFGSTLDNRADLATESGSSMHFTDASLLRNGNGGRVDNRGGNRFNRGGITIDCDSKFESHGGVVSGNPVKQLYCLPSPLFSAPGLP